MNSFEFVLGILLIGGEGLFRAFLIAFLTLLNRILKQSCGFSDRKIESFGFKSRYKNIIKDFEFTFFDYSFFISTQNNQI
jgi:hypothetical protein